MFGHVTLTDADSVGGVVGRRGMGFQTGAVCHTAYHITAFVYVSRRDQGGAAGLARLCHKEALALFIAEEVYS